MITFDINIFDDGRCQAKFSIKSDMGTYTDALIYPSNADWLAVPMEDRRAEAQGRFDRWYALITTPVVENTDLKSQLDDILTQKNQIAPEEVPTSIDAG